jgi:hypothetical protein
MPIAHHRQGAHQPRIALVTQTDVGDAENGCAIQTSQDSG